MNAFIVFLSLLILQQQPAGATVEGQVLRAATSQPLAESRILLTKVGGRLIDSIVATTDTLGRFSIANIPPGTWRVFADQDDYVRTEYGQGNVARPGSPITLAAGQRLGDVNLSLTPTGSITGRITNQDGVPVPKVYVRSFRATYAQGERTMSLVQETQSNDLGEYRLFGLTPGIYFVGAAPYTPPQIRDGFYIVPTPPTLDSFGEGYSRSSLAPRLTAGGPIAPLALSGDSYAQVYYPGALDIRAAKPVDLQPGTVVRGVDLNTMLTPRAALFRVSGQFIDGTTGRNATNVRWSINQAGLLPPVRDGESVSGTFEAFDIATGRYNLSGAVVGAGVLTIALSGTIAIEVSNGNLDNLRIVLNTPINLTGQVTGMIPVLSAATVTLQPLSGGRQPIRPDGTFSIPNVRAGDYALTLTGAPPNYYIASAKVGNTDVTANLHLDASPAEPLTIVISPNAGIIDGLVLGAGQRPAAGAMVVLVPELSRRKRFDLYRTATSDSSGRFHLEGIIPGDYKVFAWDNIEENSWQDPDVIRIYEDQGRPVRINDASRETLELTIRGQ